MDIKGQAFRSAVGCRRTFFALLVPTCQAEAAPSRRGLLRFCSIFLSRPDCFSSRRAAMANTLQGKHVLRPSDRRLSAAGPLSRCVANFQLGAACMVEFWSQRGIGESGPRGRFRRDCREHAVGDGPGFAAAAVPQTLHRAGCRACRRLQKGEVAPAGTSSSSTAPGHRLFWSF